MNFRKFSSACFLLFFTAFGFCQIPYDYGFQKKFDIHVTDSLGNSLQMPWVGGMNCMQFSEIDLNNDGIMDLFAFDKTGNKVLTFINQGIHDSISYVYDYTYEKYFPPFTGWAQLIDYNHDNKPDIFCYSNIGGIAAYKNVSDTVLKFQLLYPIINSDMGQAVSNIALTPDDYPAIYDIDGDGDLDILTFFSLGTFITYHKNISQELYGNSDTLVYKLRTECWGDVAENAMNNHIDLNKPCPWRNDEPISKAERHVGSTLLAGNFNGDSQIHSSKPVVMVVFFALCCRVAGFFKNTA